MNRAFPLVLALLAACDEPCPFQEQSFVFDGQETSGQCIGVFLNVTFYDGYVRGTLGGGVFGSQPELQLDFVDADLPAQFTLEERQSAPAERPWAHAIFRFHDASGPVVATSGAAVLSMRDGRAVVDVQGLLARRDGVERAFTAMLSGKLEVNCAYSCGPAACKPDDEVRCARFKALSGAKAE